MKKWLVVLCFSIVGTVAFAQMDPHAHSQKNILEQQSRFSEIDKELRNGKGNFNNRDPHAVNLGTAIERQVVKAQVQAQQDPHWPQADAYHDVQTLAVKTSDRPSYYVNEDTWLTCKDIEVCEIWAREQAQKDMHFLVLSVKNSLKEDQHNQRLEVRYSANFEEKTKIFEEDFNNGWEEK